MCIVNLEVRITKQIEIGPEMVDCVKNKKAAFLVLKEESLRELN